MVELQGETGMKRFTSFGCLMMFFLLLTPLPARAEMTVTIVNGSSLEINYLYLDSGEGGMGSSMSLVPGNRINMNDGNASILKGLTVFAGTKRYVFESMSLPGPKQVLRFVLHDDGVPALFPEGESQSSAQGESFDVETGPIWDNDDAQERCPEVLAAWMEANPGKEAEWTGNWTTTVEGETSVCNLRLRNASSKVSALSSGSITGKSIPLIPEGTVPVDLAQVLAAHTMADLRPMNITEASYPFAGEFFLPVNFAETTWLARIIPENGGEFFGKNVDECPISSIVFHTAIDDEGLKNIILALSSVGYRPWFAYVKNGEKMNIIDAIHFWDNADTPTQSDAEETMAESCVTVFSETDPIILEGIYISAKCWDEAVKGENPVAPVMRLHVTSNKNLSLVWMADGSTLIEASRE